MNNTVVNSWLLSRNNADPKGSEATINVLKKNQPANRQQDFFKNEDETKTSPDQQKLREFIASSLSSQDVLKEVHQKGTL